MKEIRQASTENIKPALDGEIEYWPITGLPQHDSVWGLCTGYDGNIYLADCGELTGGLNVFILRYRPTERKLEYLLDVGPAMGEPPDNGHATQSKIHYCLLPGSDGLLYCATHASGPPLGDPIWRPWNCWDDPARWFSGSYLFTFDPETGRVENFGIGPVKEGTRAMALDEKRRLLYGITWPRNHLYLFSLTTKEYKDLGRIGDVNPQAIFLDRQGNAWTTDDYGFFLKCEVETHEIRKVIARCPFEPYRIGWHNVPYDVIPAPDWSCFYGTDWGYESHLWRFDPYCCSEGKVEDLGRAFGPPDFKTDLYLERWQVRGLVFGMDGRLYFTMRLGWEQPEETWLLRLDITTGKREKVACLVFGEHRPLAIASATFDFYGNLYFAEAGTAPSGFYIYRPKKASAKPDVFSEKDIKPWG
ncbi:MAG: hypothetical protein NC911_11220 [Candidatus Omnitrophica bacterium]|nr:hypothetical protein [Candidatus Omnitrophota bacterium]